MSVAGGGASALPATGFPKKVPTPRRGVKEMPAAISKVLDLPGRFRRWHGPEWCRLPQSKGVGKERPVRHAKSIICTGSLLSLRQRSGAVEH
jgi:hypothetical protein